MTIAACPRCSDEVRVPSHASPKAIVRCPLCREQFALGELLDQAPPLLEVLDDPEPLLTLGAPAAAPAAALAEAAPTAAAPADEYKLAGAGAGVFDTTGPAGVAVSAPRPGAAVRRKKKEGSLVGMAIQVVLGGVGAFVLACPTVWWIKRSSDDPFGVAKYVEPYAPWILPPELRSKSKPSGAQNTASTTAAQTNSQALPPAGKKNNNAEKPFDFNAALAANNPGLTTDKPEAPIDPNDPLATIAPEPKGNTPSALDPEPVEPTSTLPANPGPKTNPAPFAPTEPPPPTPPPAPTPPAGLTPVDVQGAIAKASAAEQDFADFLKSGDLTTADGKANRLEKGTAMFESSASLGALLSQINLEDADYFNQRPEVQDHTAKLLPFSAAIGALGERRLKAPPAEPGIALVGKVTGIKAVGKLFETELTLPQGTKISVVSNQDPQITASEGEEVLVLGSVLRDPSKDWPAYKGDLQVLIRLGYWTKVAAPAP